MLEEVRPAQIECDVARQTRAQFTRFLVLAPADESLVEEDIDVSRESGDDRLVVIRR